MLISSIKFVRPLLGKRRVVVTLANGNRYKIKLDGYAVVVIPSCQQNEAEALRAVYGASWEFLLNGGPIDYLDAGAKRACARLVELLDWPEDLAKMETRDRLYYVVNHFTQAENIFCN